MQQPRNYLSFSYNCLFLSFNGMSISISSFGDETVTIKSKLWFRLRGSNPSPSASWAEAIAMSSNRLRSTFTATISAECFCWHICRGSGHGLSRPYFVVSWWWPGGPHVARRSVYNDCRGALNFYPLLHYFLYNFLLENSLRKNK